MARSIKKGPYVATHLEKKILAVNEGKTKKGVIKTWSRRSTITPDFVGWLTDTQNFHIKNQRCVGRNATCASRTVSKRGWNN